MIRTISPQDMREMERAFLDGTGFPSLLLMEHAAQELVRALSELAPAEDEAAAVDEEADDVDVLVEKHARELDAGHGMERRPGGGGQEPLHAGDRVMVGQGCCFQPEFHGGGGKLLRRQCPVGTAAVHVKVDHVISNTLSGVCHPGFRTVSSSLI